jgi:hypothetical protein
MYYYEVQETRYLIQEGSEQHALMQTQALGICQQLIPHSVWAMLSCCLDPRPIALQYLSLSGPDSETASPRYIVHTLYGYFTEIHLSEENCQHHHYYNY